MTTKDLIAKLQAADPSGELTVVLNEETTQFTVEAAEGYSGYDDEVDEPIKQNYVYITQQGSKDDLEI